MSQGSGLTDIFDKALHHIGRSGEKATFVQIGAMDGVSFDDASGYISGYGWVGLYVEPVPSAFANLVRNKGHQPHVFEPSAIVETNGPVEMLIIDPAAIEQRKVHECFAGMSAVWPPRNGLASDGDREVVEQYGRRILVNGITLDALFTKHNITSFDILLVDTEGLDWVVFKQLDLQVYRPKVIRLEQINLSQEELALVRHKLSDNGYVVEIWGQNIDGVLTTVLDSIPQPAVPAASTPRGVKGTTLVTALYDLASGGRAAQCRDSDSRDLGAFEQLLRSCKDTPMLVYVDESDVGFVQAHRAGSAGTDIRIKTLEDFRTWFAFYDDVQAMRQRPAWFNQSGWLAESPQARLELYNPVAMSKMFLLNDAAIFDPFGSDHYCWIDPGVTRTADPGHFSDGAALAKLESLLEKFLFVCCPYADNRDLQGFDPRAAAHYAGVSEVERVALGTFFGGHRQVLAEINAAYYSLLGRTLRAGYMGTDESVYTILTYTHAHLMNIEMIDGDGQLRL